MKIWNEIWDYVKMIIIVVVVVLVVNNVVLINAKIPVTVSSVSAWHMV